MQLEYQRSHCTVRDSFQGFFRIVPDGTGRWRGLVTKGWMGWMDWRLTGVAWSREEEAITTTELHGDYRACWH